MVKLYGLTFCTVYALVLEFLQIFMIFPDREKAVCLMSICEDGIVEYACELLSKCV